MFRAVDVDWHYEGTYLEVQWFTGRIIGTPVLCTVSGTPVLCTTLLLDQLTL
jgi:hypothetical protein